LAFNDDAGSKLTYGGTNVLQARRGVSKKASATKAQHRRHKALLTRIHHCYYVAPTILQAHLGEQEGKCHQSVLTFSCLVPGPLPLAAAEAAEC
jgi:hypothetical protein